MASRLDHERLRGLAVGALVLTLAVAMVAVVHLVARASAGGLAGAVVLLLGALAVVDQLARRGLRR